MKKSLLFRLQFTVIALLAAPIHSLAAHVDAARTSTHVAATGLTSPARAAATLSDARVAANPSDGSDARLAANPAAATAPTDSLWFQGDSLTLQEATIATTFRSKSSSPLRLTTIQPDQIAARASARNYPELLKHIPGIYATSETGNYGDARINIRGFGQENISILLNGIPISGLTSGNMFWNNWMGLSDATHSIQAQKGVGGSMLSDNSVGGTINIITATPTPDPTFRTAFYAGAGNWKAFADVNTGEFGPGLSISALVSYVGGPGYVDRTNVNSWSYMLNISKKLGYRNILLLTALGSPEQHEQRSTKLSYEEVQAYGLKYNKNWGYRGDQPYNMNKNNYFKPYFTLQHIYSGDKLTMRNSLYLAIGNGGGRWSESKGRALSTYRTTAGLIDWAAIEAANAHSTSLPAEGSSAEAMAEGSATNILSDYLAGHTQAGAVASGTYRFDDKWALEAGAHYQYYSTWESEKITDLLGGAYWYEDYATKSLAGLAGRNPIKQVGDYIRTNNGKVTHHATLYASGSFQTEKWDLRLGASVFSSRTRRWDRYNYVGADQWSATASGTGFSTKAGIMFRPARGHYLYLNGGIYSRLPYPGTYFASGNNTISKNVRNENNFLTELGYRFVYNRGSVEATAYYTYWKNKTLMSDPYRQLDEVENVRYMISGLDARHYGLEIEALHRFTSWLELSAYASIGEWTWQNDVSANIYDDYTGALLREINVYSAGLPVGDAPQTQLGAILTLKFLRQFSFSADWQFNDRMYADFDPEDRTDPNDRAASYRIPSYHLLNATLSWTGEFRKSRSTLTVFATCNNILNTLYIERGQDGAAHDLSTFRGFWALGRTATLGLRLTL